MISLVLWTKSSVLMISTGVLGFFIASFGPTHAEVGVLITTNKFFNIAYGYVQVVCGVGLLLGPPVAGEAGCNLS